MHFCFFIILSSKWLRIININEMCHSKNKANVLETKKLRYNCPEILNLKNGDLQNTLCVV